MTKERALCIYQIMNEIRRFEERAWTLFTENKLRGSVHATENRNALIGVEFIGI